MTRTELANKVKIILDEFSPGGVGLPFDEYIGPAPVSYTHLRAHETVLDLVCRLLLEKKKKKTPITSSG